MFVNQEKVLNMVEGSYKKLKSYYYYDKTLLYIKNKIAEFESNNLIFNEGINSLVNNLILKNEDYFEELISKIDFIVLPKSFKSKIKTESGTVRCNIDQDKDINKINFFIDAPIELLILDTLWMLLIGKISQDNYGTSKYSYAGRIKQSIFKKDKDLYDGIEFKSNRCFEPYFGCYTSWRDNALDSVKQHQNEADIVMMSLDLKSFYYLVKFDFEELDSMLNNDDRVVEIKFISKIMKKVYMKYTNKISKYRKGIKDSEKYSVFPIGLLSPIVLREIYLRRLDEKFIDKLIPYYYGRYVDDILIVIPVDKVDDYTAENFINKYLVDNNIIHNKDLKNDYSFIEYSNLKIQKEKVNCFFFEKGIKNILVDVYDKMIRTNSSEANLLPDMELLNESFNSRAYDINTSDGSSKIRDVNFMQSNNYNATLFVNGLKQIIKNTDYTPKMIESYLDEIIEFYSDSQGVEFSGSWRSVFELLVLCRDKERANKFYKNIEGYINRLSFDLLIEDDIYKKKRNCLLNRLRKNLKQQLKIAVSLAVSLDYESGKKKEHKELAYKFRISNMINHNLIVFPLLNYSISDRCANMSLISSNTTQLLSDPKARRELFKLDDQKIKWTPRFIHLNELHFCLFFYSLGNSEKLNRSDNNKTFSKYLKMNNLSDKIPNPIIEEDKNDLKNTSKMAQVTNVVEHMPSGKTKIGLVNTNVSEENVSEYLLKPLSGMSLESKQRLYRVLNTAREEKITYLVFPEFYLPILWLSDISNFAKRYGITIVTGLQYIACNKRVYNIMCVVKSLRSKTGFKNSLPLFREKNYYAPAEKVNLSKLGYYCQDTNDPFYYIINNGHTSIGIILCFEFTDIDSRACMKSKINLLFIPQLNRDTNYFSSIVESASRDLHCFVIQANTSVYGDSRITAPYKTHNKDIVRIKGGSNDLVIIGEIDIVEFKRFQRNYDINLKKEMDICGGCKNVKNRSITKLVSICRNCNKAPHKSKTKGLPPNYILGDEV